MKSLAYEILTQGGSGFGISKYRKIYYCPRKFNIDQAFEESNDDIELTPEVTDKKGNPKPDNLAVGSIFHYFMHCDCQEELSNAA